MAGSATKDTRITVTGNGQVAFNPRTLNQSPFACLSVKDLSTILALADRQVKVLSAPFH